MKTFSITLKGLSYCKIKRNIADITFKRLYETKPVSHIKTSLNTLIISSAVVI